MISGAAQNCTEVCSFASYVGDSSTRRSYFLVYDEHSVVALIIRNRYNMDTALEEHRHNFVQNNRP